MGKDHTKHASRPNALRPASYGLPLELSAHYLRPFSPNHPSDSTRVTGVDQFFDMADRPKGVDACGSKSMLDRVVKVQPVCDTFDKVSLHIQNRFQGWSYQKLRQ